VERFLRAAVERLESVMIVLVGLVILVAATTVAIAGVLGNDGHSHALAHGFSVFGYHVTGSNGSLFLSGIVVGAIALVGLSLLLAGSLHASRSGSAARRGLRESRRETATANQDRDDLINERDSAVGQAARLRVSAARRRRRERKVADQQAATTISAKR
jgi:uncharacterized membrane protein